MWDKNRSRLSYLRLSKEDIEVASGAEAESISIGSQRLCIRQYIDAHPDLGPSDSFEELVDDGYSGTNFDRPGIARLLELVEAGRVETIIVRDLSRFARNYLEAGHFLELVFPAHDVRFISINDHYDSRELGESTAGFQLAVRNLINHLYSRDISRKIKSAVDLKKMNGEYVYGTAPYGYKKGPQRNTIIVDPEAASVVRQIFGWASDGVTVTQIAARLNQAGVQTPSAYLQAVRGRYKVRPYWTFDSVKNILVNRIYTGDTVPFKSHVAAIGSNRVKRVPEEERIVIPDTHEAIVSRETYYLSRKVIKSNVKSSAKGPSSVFSSYLVCGCCGNKLHKGRRSSQTFRCVTARYAPDSPCGEVSIQEEHLSSVLLRAIQSQCAIADAKVRLAKTVRKDAQTERAIVERELKEQQRRLEKSQADAMRYYEDYISGKLSRERFLEKSAGRRKAEEDARSQAAVFSARLSRMKEETISAEEVILEAGTLERYLQAEQLSPELMLELVRRIIVYPGGAIHIDWNFKDVFHMEKKEAARA